MTTQKEKSASGGAHPTITDVFERLDQWRHLPAYRLEPRADAFFAVFMKDVVEKHLGVTLLDELIPEFPLRKGNLWEESEADPAHRNKSVKVDYLAFDESVARAFLIELKTDAASRRDGQDKYLTRAAELGFRPFIEGLVQMTKATSRAGLPKYLHLLHRLSVLGFLTLPDELYARAFPLSPGVLALLDDVTLTTRCNEVTLQVVYVQPLSDKSADVIDFEEFAKAIEERGELGTSFATYLRRWVAPAGGISPRVARG